MQDDTKEPINEELNQEPLSPETERVSEAPETQVEQQESQVEKKPVPTEEQGEQPDSSAQQVSDDDNTEAEKQADKLRDVQHEGRKIEQLLSLAQDKGVDFAVNVAKKTNDPTLLDLLHDKIVEKGLHKDIG